MKPNEYLDFCEDDIFLNLRSGDFYSEDKANEIIQTLKMFIKKLSNVRHSEEKTKLILNEIDELSDNEMRTIKHWLTKAIEKDDSYVYAFNPLAQHSNRQTILVCYQVKYISKSELFELLKADEDDNTLNRTYIIKDDVLMQKVYDICESMMDCDYLTFRKSIESANFQLLKIMNITFVQDMTYRLSSIMGKEWFNDIQDNMSWKRGICSGRSSKLEDNTRTKKLDKILKRPSKQ